MSEDVVAGDPPAWRSRRWAKYPALRHGFWGRQGGTSAAPFDSLNLSDRGGDLSENVRANWQRLQPSLGQAEVARMHQVHGSTLARIESLPAEVPEADGLVTLTPGLALAVLTADCVPILLVAPRAGAVAAVHAGWRGTVARIAQVAVEKLCRWSGEPPSAIEAALGPSIGACCYQVGVEVAEPFGAWRKPPASLRRESEQVEKWRIDLRQANVEALREAGLSESAIEIVGPCTCCADDRFFSFRAARGAATGRQASVIAWCP